MMQLNSAIIFRVPDEILQAFINSDIPSFAILQARNVIYSYVGQDIEDAAADLAKELEVIRSSGNTAVFTLRTYIEITKRAQINEKTPANVSVNFKLNEPGQVMKINGPTSLDPDRVTLTSRVIMMEGRMDQIMEAINKISERLEGEEETEEGPTLMEHITGLLSNEAATRGIGSIIAGIKQALAAPAVALAGVGTETGDAPIFTPGSVTAKERPITDQWDPIPILLAADPDLVKDLQKLAIISKDNPTQFKLFLTMLRSLK